MLRRTHTPGTPVELSELQARFGQVVRRRRQLTGLGQMALAHDAGLHRTHLSLIERGRQMPSLAVVHKLATALKVSMAELIAEVEDEPADDGPPPIKPGRPPKPKADALPPGAKRRPPARSPRRT